MKTKNSEFGKRLLRVHVVARLVRRSPRTVRRRIENHELPAIRIGRRAWGVRACDVPIFWHVQGVGMLDIEFFTGPRISCFRVRVGRTVFLLLLSFVSTSHFH
jgi:hypothetical protein